MIKEALDQCGLIAILRGIQPDEVTTIAHGLYSEGFRLLEVPLNSPQPFESIRRLKESLPNDCIVGAGTVYLPAQVEEVRAAGGTLIVMPHCDAEVVQVARSAQLDVLPGVATPTEAFEALRLGVTLLKAFPADHLGPATIRAWRLVLPQEVSLIPVGGILLSNVTPLVASGAIGLGIGSALYRPGAASADVIRRGREFVAAWREATAT